MKDPITELREEIGITDEALNLCAKTAYDLLKSGRPHEAAKVSKGLIVADRKNPYFRTLYATALVRKREYKEALAVVDEGLTHSPQDQHLVALRESLLPAVGGRP
jgi:hypothetical protein